MKYDNAVDEDSPSGCAGGFDAHGNYIIPDAMVEILELRAEIERLRDAITEANEAMRDGSDLTAWAILVAALAGKEAK